MASTAEELILAVQSRGSDAIDLRDAAHEASHALEAGARRWDREAIHRALLRKFRRPGDLVASEVEARAVEQLVCAHFGVDCGKVERWADWSILEALKHRLPIITDRQFMVKAIRTRMASKRTQAHAAKVIALVVSVPGRRTAMRSGSRRS